MGQGAIREDPMAAARAVLRALRRRWWLLLAMSLAGLALGVAFVPSKPDRFMSTCVVLVPGVPGGPTSSSTGRGPSSFQSFYYYLQTQIRLITTRPVAGAAVEKLDPETRRSLGADPAGAILAGLSVERPKETLLLRITYIGLDPDVASKVANAVAEAFAEAGLERWRRTASAAAGELSSQLADLEADIVERGDRLAKLRESYGLDQPNAMEAAAGRAGPIRVQLAAAQSDRIDLGAQSQLASARKGDTTGLLALPRIASDTEVAGLRSALSQLAAKRAVLTADEMLDGRVIREVEESGRFLRAKLAVAVVAAAARLAQGHELACRREEDLRKLLEREESRMRDIQVAQARLEKLASEIAYMKESRDSVARAWSRSELSSRVKFSGAQIVEPARRGARLSGSRWRGAAVAALAGLVLAGLVSGLLEAFDDRIRSAEDIRDTTDADIIGIIPRMERPAGRWEPDLAVHLKPRSAGAEAARAMRVQILSLLGEGPKAICVTSAAPREGKSTVASSLAIALAQSERKTLLVDADMRRGSLHKSFEVEAGPGLAEYLDGSCGLHVAVRSTAVACLNLLPAGGPTHRPAELAESRSFVEMLTRLRNRYDCIVIDTPPVIAVADPIPVAIAADATVVVVQSDASLKRPLQRAVEMLRRSGANIIGTVANDVRPSSSYGYDHRYAYRHGEDYFSRSASQ